MSSNPICLFSNAEKIKKFLPRAMFCSPLGRHSPRGTGEKGVEILDSVLMFLLQLPAPGILLMAHLGSSASAHLSVTVGVVGD